MQWWALAPLGAFVLISATTRIVSLGSIFGSLLACATILTVPALRQYWLIGIAAPAIVIWTHRGNIARLLAGTEPRLGEKPPASDGDKADDQPAEETSDDSDQA